MLHFSPDQRIAASPDLHAGIEVIEDIVILEDAVAVVVEIHADLFSRVDAVPPKHRCGSGRDPDAGQRVGVNFVLLDQPLALLMHVDATVLPMMDFVVPNDRVAAMNMFKIVFIYLSRKKTLHKQLLSTVIYFFFNHLLVLICMPARALPYMLLCSTRPRPSPKM